MKIQSETIRGELGMLHTRAVIVVQNYLDYPITEKTHQSMETFLRDYKKHKPEVQTALIDAFKFLVKERYEDDPDDPVNFPAESGTPPAKESIKSAKIHINRIAQKIWKK